MCVPIRFSQVQLCTAPGTVARHATLSMELSRQEYWSGLPFPFPGDLPNRRIQPSSPALAGRLFTTEPPGKPPEVWRSPYAKDSLSMTWRCPLPLNTKAHTCPPPHPLPSTSIPFCLKDFLTATGAKNPSKKLYFET